MKNKEQLIKEVRKHSEEVGFNFEVNEKLENYDVEMLETQLKLLKLFTDNKVNMEKQQ